MPSPPPILGFCAYSGTGKTTLLEKLLPLLQAEGLRVGLLKHTHHQFDMDQPGKDSYRLRAAGANPVMLASSQRWVLMQETKQQAEADFKQLISILSQQAPDLILVEGFRHEAFAKIEIYRPALQQPLLCQQDSHIIAVAADAPLATALSIPILPLNQPAQIAQFILDYMA